jgi:hypothetical protein
MGDSLLISQLILCLQTISKSGTVVIKLSKPERVVTAQVLYMLDILSLSLASWKPVFIHATRPTFYAVAKGLGNGRHGHRLLAILYGLKTLWVELAYGGAEGKGRGLKFGDLDFIISQMELEKTYGSRLQELGGHVWLVQKESLKGWYQMEGVADPDPDENADINLKSSP